MAIASPEVVAAHGFIAAINARDPRVMARLMTENHTFIDSVGTVVSGRDTMLASWQAYWTLLPDYRIRIDTVVREGRVVAIFGGWSATYAGRRGRVQANAVGGPAAWKAIVTGGRIEVWQVYADHTRTTAVMQQDAADVGAVAGER
jgi:ketosteroid isomerase-like protein